MYLWNGGMSNPEWEDDYGDLQDCLLPATDPMGWVPPVPAMAPVGCRCMT